MAAKKQAAAKAEYEGKRTLYKVEGESVVRERRSCPKCGPGIFMATHKNRAHCGRCGHTEFTKKE
jgi:ubiquitin-small subunit ribosomal protein S27Ae